MTGMTWARAVTHLKLQKKEEIRKLEKCSEEWRLNTRVECKKHEHFVALLYGKENVSSRA